MKDVDIKIEQAKKKLEQLQVLKENEEKKLLFNYFGKLLENLEIKELLKNNSSNDTLKKLINDSIIEILTTQKSE